MQLELRFREMHSSLRLWSTLVEGLHTWACAEILWRDVPKRAFHIMERFFWENLSDASVERSLCTSSIAHNVGGLIKEWFTFFL